MIGHSPITPIGGRVSLLSQSRNDVGAPRQRDRQAPARGARRPRRPTPATQRGADAVTDAAVIADQQVEVWRHGRGRQRERGVEVSARSEATQPMAIPPSACPIGDGILKC